MIRILLIVILDLFHLVKVLLVDLCIGGIMRIFVNEELHLNEFFGGKTVLITGASSGLGEQLCIQLAKLRPSKPINLILTARDVTRLDEVSSACKSLAPNSVVIVAPLDISLIDDDNCTVISQYVDGLREKLAENNLTKVDCLINNAGISSRGNAMDTSSKVLMEVMQTNFFGPVSLTKALFRSLLRQDGRGSIGIISSVQGLLGIPGRTCYAASKHALQGYFECFRAEVAPSGVNVTIASPGYINTSLSLNAVTGNGEKHGKMDDNTRRGMDAGTAARKTLVAIANRCTDVLICDAKSEAAVLGKIQFPNLLASVLKAKTT